MISLSEFYHYTPVIEDLTKHIPILNVEKTSYQYYSGRPRHELSLIGVYEIGYTPSNGMIFFSMALAHYPGNSSRDFLNQLGMINMGVVFTNCLLLVVEKSCRPRWDDSNRLQEIIRMSRWTWHSEVEHHPMDCMWFLCDSRLLKATCKRDTGNHGFHLLQGITTYGPCGKGFDDRLQEIDQAQKP
jgi:hypothetical protein